MKSGKKIVFSPFTRVEGDLSLAVEISDGAVESARVSGTLFRGFEDMVRGRDPLDAIVFLCRICGQCGAAHSTGAASALAHAWGAEVPENGLLARSVIQAAETILSHLTHFYSSFAPDLCSLPAGRELAGRFEGLKGSSFRRSLEARRSLLGLMGLFAGKWPNTLAIQPGGSTRTLNRSELTRAQGIVGEFRHFVEGQFLGGPVDRWLQNESLADLEEWASSEKNGGSDVSAFIAVALAEGLQGMGRGPRRFLSSGGFLLPGPERWLASGCRDGGLEPFEPGLVSEDVSFAWYEGEKAAAHPFEEADLSRAPEKEDAYSWARAVRYSGEPAEVGPAARLLVDRDTLAEDLVGDGPADTFSRELLRLHEMVRLTAELPSWIDRINPREPFYIQHEPSESARGFAVTEAPRGVLGHWVEIEKSKISNYQVVTPTGWNLSPRDAHEREGPLEGALVGTPVRDPENAAEVMLVVRSFDPCLYCSVH